VVVNVNVDDDDNNGGYKHKKTTKEILKNREEILDDTKKIIHELDDESDEIKKVVNDRADDIENQIADPDTEDHRDIDILGFSYQGGFVLEPKRGLYRNLKVVDVVYLSILQ
jgi:hypothetical protein